MIMSDGRVKYLEGFTVMRLYKQVVIPRWD